MATRNYICPSCESGGVNDVIDAPLTVEGGTVDRVKEFPNLGNVFEEEGGVEKVVRARVAVAWMKWREIDTLLMN